MKRKTLVAVLLVGMLLMVTSMGTLAASENAPLKGLVMLGGVLVNDVGTGPAYEALVETTGYPLELDVYQPDQTENSINLAMASREKYDYIRGASNSMLFNYVENSAVAPLTESIEKYGQDLKALFPQDVWDAFTFDDGNIYAIPSLSNPRIWFTMTMRTDWLETLGLPIPSTVEEFVTTLRAFKEKDPGEVGLDNVIPFSTSVFSGNMINYDPFLGAFGITYPWVEQEGKMVHRVMLPAFREYVKFYRDLYTEGLLDMDIAVVKDDTLQEKVNRGVVGLARYNYYYAYLSWTMWDNEKTGWKLNFIPGPVGPDGLSGQQVDTSLAANIFVPAWSNRVDDVVKFANAFAKNYEYLLIGKEGVHWNWEGEKRIPVLPIFNEQRGDTFFYQPVVSGQIEYPLWLVRVNKTAYQGKAYADCMKATEGQTQINPLAYALNLPTTANLSPTLEKMINDTVLRIVVGDLPLDFMDDLIKNWKAEGGDLCTQEVNDWYANQAK